MPNLSHELLAGEDEFEVAEPSGRFLEQRRVRVNVHRVLVLHSLVVTWKLTKSVNSKKYI